jgi:hypothetical protein
MTSGNIAQNGIRKTYRNQPTPGVMMPMKVNSPMMPKMNAPSRILSGQARFGSLKCSDPLPLSAAGETASADEVTSPLPSSWATIAATPSSIPWS